MTALLDVNVLIALSDPGHLNYYAAHRWFERRGSQGWATCALTENAFIRITSNPAFPGRRTTMEDAVLRLRDSCTDSRHIFWSDAISVRDSGRFDWHHAQGHRQIADVYLLALSVANHGKLATFDTGISLRSVVGATADNLDLVVG